MATPGKIIDGQFTARGLKMGLVAARFNAFVVERLVEGAFDAFTRTGGALEDVTLVRCPGAFEVPQVARRLSESGAYDVIVCLGCVIRGATPHFDYVAGAAARGVAEVAMQSRVPVVFGVLTTDTLEQAVERAGAKAGNKGFDATMAAIEMASVYAQIGTQKAR